MARSQYDTIIIGLGAAGVTAAATLGKAGKQVLGLEAEGRIGGRVNTVPFGDGVVELGAEWIHGEHPSLVYDTAVQNNIQLAFQDLAFNIFRSDGQVPNEEFQLLCNEVIAQGFIFMANPPEESIPAGQFVTAKLMQYFKDNNPKILEDQDLVEQLLEFLNLLTNNYCACNDWNDLDARDKFTHLDGHQHISWYKQGYKTFFDIMLNTYRDGPGLSNLNVKLNTEVTQIAWPEDPNGTVKVITKDGAVYTADSVIITVSVGVLKESYKTLFTPKLPAKKIAAIENLAIGVMDKIVLSFETAWWPKNATFFGFLWQGEDRRRIGREDYWITRIFGASSPMGSDNVLTLWTSGETAKMVELLPEDLVRRKCMQLLQMFMGGKTIIPEPTGFIRSTWHSNPYTRGSYSYDSIHVASLPWLRSELAAPLTDRSGKPRVLFAGEATDETHFSTVHGACDTGYRESMRLLPASKM
ncbi:probable polyamine oxidase 5 [Hyposmocoma kahamanoa]|uniref:probable polyamine oxidase 5 n=1 Tax=Hyposmocoma kahamanoa TaxID=1477025 RepID=UPI000E6D9D10|nr:probable polyamine oxidase 5 [Hyposmocoma kahamanoa]